QGGVLIEENVEIGANTCIAAGTFVPTRIRIDSKIDALCQIGHNVDVGSNCLILAKSIIGGSSRIGNNSILAISCVISDALTIEADCHIGPNTLVLSDLRKGSKIVA